MTLQDMRATMRRGQRPGRVAGVLVVAVTAALAVFLLLSTGATAAPGWTSPVNISPSSTTNQSPQVRAGRPS
jgi:hypothetical protein